MILAGDFRAIPTSKTIKDTLEAKFIDLYTLIKVKQKTYSKVHEENYPKVTFPAKKSCHDYVLINENNSWYSSNKIVIRRYLEMPSIIGT